MFIVMVTEIIKENIHRVQAFLCCFENSIIITKKTNNLKIAININLLVFINSGNSIATLGSIGNLGLNKSFQQM